MKLDQLTYFLEAAKHEHIGRAARVLAISPSAISHSISALEDELGKPLFIKRGKNILLTGDGRLLAERATDLLHQAHKILEEFGSEEVQMRGHIKLAASHGLGSNYLAPAIVKLQNRNPRITAEIFTLSSGQVRAGVISGEYDLGLCYSPQSHPDLGMTIVHKGQLVVAVKKEHPIFGLEVSERIKALNSYKATLPKAFQGIEVCEEHPVFKKFNIRPQPEFLFNNYELAIEKIANSETWGFIPDLFVKWNQNRIASIMGTPPQEWDTPYFIAVIWYKRRSATRALKALNLELSERFSQISV